MKKFISRWLQSAANFVDPDIKARDYHGASKGKRKGYFSQSRGSANVTVMRDMHDLKYRARELVRNNPYCARIVDVLTAHIVGYGIKPISNTKDRDLDERVNRLWNIWAQNCDAEGELNFYAIQELLVRSMIESGDCVLRFIDLPVKKDSRPKINLRLMVLENDFIDHSKNGIYDKRNVRLGVVVDDNGKREGLYLFKQHPGELNLLGANNGDAFASTFVPWDDAVLVYNRKRPGQVRSVSWLAPAILPASEIEELNSAVLAKAKNEAKFVMFIKRDLEMAGEETNDTGDTDGIINSKKDANGEYVSRIEDGTVTQLHPGEDITFPQVTPNTSYQPISQVQLQALGVSVGVPYHKLTGDLRGANFSSLRAGDIDFRRLIRMHQQNLVIPQICDPSYDRFIERAILLRLLPNRAEGYPRKWNLPAVEKTDPSRDENAELLKIRGLKKSPQQAAAEEGNDWLDVLDQWAEYKDELDSRGLGTIYDARKENPIVINNIEKENEDVD